MSGLSAGIWLIRGLLGLYLISMYFMISHASWTLAETALGAALCLAILARHLHVRQTPLPALFYIGLLFWIILTLSSCLNYLSDPAPGAIGAQIHKSLSLLFSILTGYAVFLYTEEAAELAFTSRLICLCTLGLCLLLLVSYTPGSAALNIEKTVLGFGSSNQNAWAMAALLAPALICATRPSAPRGLYALVALAVGGVLLTNAMATASRQGVLYAGLLLLALALRASPRARAGLAGLAVALPLWLLTSEAAQNALALILERWRRALVFVTEGGSAAEGSLPDRVEMAARALALWQQSPLYGHGIDGFARRSGYASHSHNSLTELLVSGGILAALLYAALLGGLVLRLGRAWPIAAFFMVSLLFSVAFPTRAHWIAVFLILSASRPRAGTEPV